MKKPLTPTGRTPSEPVIQSFPMRTVAGQEIGRALRKNLQPLVVKDLSELEEALRKRNQ